MLDRMRTAAERHAEECIVPHSDEVLYAGRTGKFLRASMSDLQHISSHSLEEHDAAMELLGFRCIGDVVGDVGQRQSIARCYAGHQHAIALLSHRNANNQLGWAAVSNGAISVDFSQGTKEFHTHFEDRTSLVTTSIDAVKSKPELGIYVRCYEDIPVTMLWQKHLDGIRRFKAHRNTVPVDHARFSEPAQYLAIIDDLFYRFMDLH